MKLKYTFGEQWFLLNRGVNNINAVNFCFFWKNNVILWKYNVQFVLFKKKKQQQFLHVYKLFVENLCHGWAADIFAVWTQKADKGEMAVKFKQKGSHLFGCKNMKTKEKQDKQEQELKPKLEITMNDYDKRNMNTNLSRCMRETMTRKHEHGPEHEQNHERPDVT